MDIRNFFKPTSGKPLKAKITPKVVADSIKKNAQENVTRNIQEIESNLKQKDDFLNKNQCKSVENTKKERLLSPRSSFKVKELSKIPGTREISLKGYIFFLIGNLSSISIEGAIHLIENCEGTVASSLSKEITHVVSGLTNDASLLKQAKATNAIFLQEEDFLNLFQSCHTLPSVSGNLTTNSFTPINYKECSNATEISTKKELPESVSLLSSVATPFAKPFVLSGMTFILIGKLKSLDRVSTLDLIKNCGGATTDTVESMNTFVIIGEDADATEVTTVKSLGLQVLNENQFFSLIRSSKAKVSNEIITEEQTNTKSTNKKIKLVIKPGGSKKQATESVTFPTVVSNDCKKQELFEPEAPISPKIKTEIPRLNIVSQRPIEAKQVSNLWVDKYKPSSIHDLCGNFSNIQEILSWLSNWNPQNESESKAVLLSGPPGIGKSSSAFLACKQIGFSPIEFNASDTRNKSSIESILSEFVDNRSISEFFKSSRSTESHSKKMRPALILDEIDGMSGGDRGGVAEIIKYIKKTKIPIICICNERMSPKVRSLANHCKDLRFTRPTAASAKLRIEFIAKSEGLSLGPNVIDKLLEVTNGDIRQVINLLSTWRLSKSHMSFRDGNDYSKALQKNTVLDPFKIASKYLSASEYQAHTFSEKYEFYFHDFQLAPLIIQENYIRTKPQAVSRIPNQRAAQLEQLDRLSKAADSICDGDLIDRSIHTHQNWGLMPVHAAYSCMMPSLHMNGQLQGRIDFPQWLGKNSSSNKFSRLLRETHLHMRSRISCDKNELRQVYMPTLLKRLTNPLVINGQDGIDDVIKVMDHYYLDKEDWDSIIDLQTGSEKVKSLLQSIPTAVKSAFTRNYNKSIHPKLFQSLPTSSRAKANLFSTSEAAAEIDEVVAAEEEVPEGEGNDEEKEDTLQDDKLISKKDPNAKKRKASSAPSRATKKKAVSKK